MRTNQWRIQDFIEEGAPTPRGAPTYDLAKFSQKLHEIERIWTRGVRVPRAPPLDPPLLTAAMAATKCQYPGGLFVKRSLLIDGESAYRRGSACK